MLPNILGTSIRYTGNPIDQAVQWDDRWFWTLLNRGSCFWRSQICFFSHMAIYRKVLWMESWCGAVAKWWTRLVWSLSVVIFGIPEGCQMDEKPYDSTICGEWTFIFQLCWYPAWLLIPPFASSLARSKAGGSASMVALLKGDSQEQVRVGMARESLRDPKILWIPRVYPLVN